MANYQLTVEERTQTGKSIARKLRAAGKIPAVVYGAGKESISIAVATREVEKALAAAGSLIDLNLAGGKKTVIVKDVLKDPVRGELRHVDFQEVDLTKKLEVIVPLRVVGEEERANDGGLVQALLWETPVLCLPTDIPDAIEVDVSGLEVGQSLTLGELQLPEGVELVGDAEEVVVKIDLPSKPAAEEAEDAEDAEEEAAEGGAEQE